MDSVDPEFFLSTELFPLCLTGFDCPLCSAAAGADHSTELRQLLRDPHSIGQHLQEQHQLTIDDVGKLANAQQYAQRLVERGGCFSDHDAERECRELLEMDRINDLLRQQELEQRDMQSGRQCLFCKKFFSGGRMTLFAHMLQEHGFSAGNPHRMVHWDLFLQTVQFRLDRMQCPYCEHQFPNRKVLQQHMRKKKHFKLKPQNPVYDKFYMVNYTKTGSHGGQDEYEQQLRSYAHSDVDLADLRLREAEHIGEEEEVEDQDAEGGFAADSEDDDLDDWSDPHDSWIDRQDLRCLLCSRPWDSLEDLVQHMRHDHKFLPKEQSYNEYDCIKLLNYLRSQFPCGEKWLQEDGQTIRWPERILWDHAQYLLPSGSNPLLIVDWTEQEEEEEEEEEAEEENQDELRDEP